MIEFLRKFENRCIKISRVNPILINKSINLQFFTLILYGVGVRCDRIRFSVHSTCYHTFILLDPYFTVIKLLQKMYGNNGKTNFVF